MKAYSKLGYCGAFRAPERFKSSGQKSSQRLSAYTTQWFLYCTERLKSLRETQAQTHTHTQTRTNTHTDTCAHARVPLDIMFGSQITIYCIVFYSDFVHEYGNSGLFGLVESAW